MSSVLFRRPYCLTAFGELGAGPVGAPGRRRLSAGLAGLEVRTRPAHAGNGAVGGGRAVLQLDDGTGAFQQLLGDEEAQAHAVRFPVPRAVGMVRSRTV